MKFIQNWKYFDEMKDFYTNKLNEGKKRIFIFLLNKVRKSGTNST